MKKRIFVITMFPEYFIPFKERGVIGRALRQESETESEFSLITLNPSDFNPKSFKGVDDPPFGGGVGMVMRPDILEKTLRLGIMEKYNLDRSDLHLLFPSPRGKVWSQKSAEALKDSFFMGPSKNLVFLCGRYEGVDERFLNQYVDEYYSLGDFVLSGGEIPVMAILDSALRLVPHVLGNTDSPLYESFSDGLLEYPIYTKPREFNGVLVPEPYLSGNHKKIEEENKKQSLLMTKKYRPDLYEAYLKKNS